ncbi:MAG: protein phosphatase 2C domain-containing protein [Candidatus Methanomethylophilaceae archaeon]
MLYTYGGSFQGRSHIERKVVCQDSSINKIVEINGRKYAVLIAADGVGSAKHAEDGSRTAAEVCFDLIQNSKQLNEITLLDAYTAAFDAVTQLSNKEGNPINDYDTTLSVALLSEDGVLIYGHSGDGGIVGIKESGEYVAITKPQKGPDGQSVIPLRFGKDRWEFGTYDGHLSSVMVMTDGVLDVCVPSLLKDQRSQVYVPFVRFFSDNNVLDIDTNGIEAVSSSRMDFLNGEACSMITDDRTLLVAIDSSRNPNIMDESYYLEPDWEGLKEQWKRKAYPHLYNKNQDGMINKASSSEKSSAVVDESNNCSDIPKDSKSEDQSDSDSPESIKSETGAKMESDFSDGNQDTHTSSFPSENQLDHSGSQPSDPNNSSSDSTLQRKGLFRSITKSLFDKK